MQAVLRKVSKDWSRRTEVVGAMKKDALDRIELKEAIDCN